MSMAVAGPISTVNVVQLGNGAEGDHLSSPISSTNLWMAVGGTRLMRLTLYISSPAAAMGSSAAITVSAVDENGKTNTLSTKSIGPGSSDVSTGVLSVKDMTMTSYSISPVDSETILSDYTYRIAVEVL